MWQVALRKRMLSKRRCCASVSSASALHLNTKQLKESLMDPAVCVPQCFQRNCIITCCKLFSLKEAVVILDCGFKYD